MEKMKKSDVIKELKSNIKTAIVNELAADMDKIAAEKLADRLVEQIVYNMGDEGGFTVVLDGIMADPTEDNAED